MGISIWHILVVVVVVFLLFGNPERTPIDETAALAPTSAYGDSKLMVERMLQDAASAYGLRSVALRYFNAAGAWPEGTIGEDHGTETHLVPLILKTALGQRQAISIYGTDYATADGTCIRDYIHVCDLAQAHVLADGRRIGGAVEREAYARRG